MAGVEPGAPGTGVSDGLLDEVPVGSGRVDPVDAAPVATSALAAVDADEAVGDGAVGDGPPQAATRATAATMRTATKGSAGRRPLD
jgi:hypothetical protein